MAKYSREFYEAMDAFLLSEQKRHEEDIEMIQAKREQLHAKGYRCDDPAPWIDTDDIEAPELVKFVTLHSIMYPAVPDQYDGDDLDESEGEY